MITGVAPIAAATFVSGRLATRSRRRRCRPARCARRRVRESPAGRRAGLREDDAAGADECDLAMASEGVLSSAGPRVGKAATVVRRALPRQAAVAQLRGRARIAATSPAGRRASAASGMRMRGIALQALTVSREEVPVERVERTRPARRPTRGDRTRSPGNGRSSVVHEVCRRGVRFGHVMRPPSAHSDSLRIVLASPPTCNTRRRRREPVPVVHRPGRRRRSARSCRMDHQALDVVVDAVRGDGRDRLANARHVGVGVPAVFSGVAGRPAERQFAAYGAGMSCR